MARREKEGADREGGAQRKWERDSRGQRQTEVGRRWRWGLRGTLARGRDGHGKLQPANCRSPSLPLQEMGWNAQDVGVRRDVSRGLSYPFAPLLL